MSLRTKLSARLVTVALAALAGCASPTTGSAGDATTRGGGAADTTTLADLAPSAATVTLSPAAPRTDDDLVVSIIGPAVDPEGAAVAYRYVWSVDGVVQTDLTGDSVPASRTTKGQRWTVVVIATDGKQVSSSAEAAITVLNTRPTATLVVDPMAPTVVSDLTAVVSSFDADGDEVAFTYAWTVDGNETAFDGATVPASALVRGQAWEATVVPNDGEEDGELVADFATIGNARPVVVGLQLSPARPTVLATLTATVSQVNDADLDDVTFAYSWTVNGVEVPGAEGAQLSAPSFKKGDFVGIQITPFDGLDAGEALLATVVIEDAPPTVPTIDLTPVAARDTNDLDCTVTTPSIDADGDSVTYTFNWTRSVDGGPFELFGDAVPVTDSQSRVPAASTQVRERYRCTVTATDGLLEATTASVEAEVVDHSVGAVCDPVSSPCDAGLGCFQVDVLGGMICTKTGCTKDTDCGEGNLCDSTLGIALCLRGCDPFVPDDCHRSGQTCWTYGLRANGRGMCGGDCNDFADLSSSCPGLVCSAGTGLCEGTADAYRACGGTTGLSCKADALCLQGLSGNATTGGANCLPAFCLGDADCDEVPGSVCGLSIPTAGSAPDYSCSADTDCDDTSPGVAAGSCKSGVCQYRWGLCALPCDAPGAECPVGTTCQTALGSKFCVE